MEAVPRLPMYFFELKVSPDRPPTEFSKLKQYIRDLYNEDPETYSTEIRNLETLRAQAVHPVKDINGCSILKKYYCQLHFLESRFPLSKDGPVSFTWRDIYSGIVYTVNDIKSEIVAILYNIGALHSHMGASDDRTTPEGLKMACTHFQCAAWAFQHIKDSFPQPSGMDVSPDLMQFMYHLCLAQAQECILEKSMTDNRKATINARVATQIVDYYNLAQNALLQGGSNDDGTLAEVVGSKLMKNWKKYVRFKATYYTCVSLLYQGMQSEEQQKMGERVAYFQAALDKLSEAIKLSKGLDQAEAITESLLFTRDVVEGKRKAAKSENEFIYHEEVVDADSLPTIKGASLVKGISFNINDPDISGPDIFTRLVPMKAHEASSLYSEEKAKVLRRINGLIDAKDEEVVSYMSCLQLDHLKAHLESDTLPQEVVDRCAALSVKPDAIPNLIAAMDKLNDAYHDVDGMLEEIMQLIKTEEKNEKEYQDIMGSRAPSIVATDLTREANKYMEAHKKAADSNETLNRAMSQHVENLRVLQQTLPELQAQLPTLAPLDLHENESLKEVTMLVGKVDEMRKQRAMLASQLRESICSDDITAILVTRGPENTDQLFEQELKKHVKYVNLIEQNLAAQENILKALTDAYARYAPTRKATSDIIKQRELMLSALISSYDAYEDLLAKSSKGMEFYRKLETNLTKLLQRVKGTCRVQQEEREAILVKNNIKMNQEPVTPQDVPSGGPKLKDYLQKRKETQSFGGGYPVGPAAHNWLPGVRPAPVGSEVTQPLVSSTKPQEYSVPVNTYTGAQANQYQQPYTGYYGQNIPLSYQPHANNLAYTTVDHSLPSDSNPTAPYRPDSRASTCSDHSIPQQQITSHINVPAPSPDPKLSPEHSASGNQTSQLPNQDQTPTNVPNQQFPQRPVSGSFPQGYGYQGNYSYPMNYSSYGGTQAATNISAGNSSSNTFPPQQAVSAPSYSSESLKATQLNNVVTTQPSNVSIIKVNSEDTNKNILPNIGSQTSNVQTIQVSGGLNNDQQSIAQPTSNQSLNYYDPSHAKAMSVPSASYNGPYGYNTITSPYANFYTSQMYNGNVSSSVTDKTAYPLHSTSTDSQPTNTVYSAPDSSQTNFSPTKIHHIPTTTYTVPANQQFNISNVGKIANSSTTQAYHVPSLVSPTQATYSIMDSLQAKQNPAQAISNQSSGQNSYNNVSQPVASQPNSGQPESSPNPTMVPVSNPYPQGQSQIAYTQYSNYYNSNQYPGAYYRQPVQAYPTVQNATNNPYGSSQPQFDTFTNYSSYPSNQSVPTTNQSSTSYVQPQMNPTSNQQAYNQYAGSQNVPPASITSGYVHSTISTSQPNSSSATGFQPAGTSYPQTGTNIQPSLTGTYSQTVGNVPQPSTGNYSQGASSLPQAQGAGNVQYPQSLGPTAQPYVGNYAQHSGNYPQGPTNVPPTAASYPQSGGSISSGGNYQLGANTVPPAAASYSQPVASVPSGANYPQGATNVPPTAASYPQGATNAPPTAASYPQSVGIVPSGGNYMQSANYPQANSVVPTNQNITPQQTGYIQTSQPSSYVQPSHHTVVPTYNQSAYNYQGNYYQPSLQNQSGQLTQSQQTSYPPTSQPQKSVSQSSNVDLLAGLDFAVADAPLQPLPPPVSVSQISDSLSNISIDSKQKNPSVNGDSKPQV